MKRRYDIFLKDIQENIAAISEFTSGMEFEQFKADKKTLFAVCRCLEIIGEAVGLIPDDVKSRYKKIPWQDIKNFRNIVVHKYREIDVETVWDILQNELEPLDKEIKTMCEKECK
jgi:uncharacterized protein with HEPN domain